MDRLSELPDSLIFSIFKFLPMKSVVRTQLLSHRWKNLWILTPYLNFIDYSENSDVFRNFVNRFLLRWRGTRVQAFRVLGCEFGDAVYIDLDLWMRFAVDNGVEGLHLSLFQRDEEDCAFFPQCFYSCSSLQSLWLDGFKMDIRGNVEWNKLKSLTIQSEDVSAHTINQILCGSPVLEEFTALLVERESNTNLCFRSSSLKRLLISKEPMYEDEETSSGLEMWMPNVERLTIDGIPYAKCLLMDVSSLTEANFTLYPRYPTVSATALDSVEISLSQILPAIQHLKRLTLSHWCFKALENRKSKGLFSPLSNVKFLTLRGSFDEHEQIIDLLEIFPKLKTLLVVEEPKRHEAMSMLKFKPDLSEPFLQELTTVDVTCTKHDCSILPFVKSLLKHASKLEKMMLRVEGTPPPSLPVEELLSMPRSSPTAELIFCD